MQIDVVLITYNRLYYTRPVLESLLQDRDEAFRLFIWDNHSTDGTVEYLKEEVRDPRIADMVFCSENQGQWGALNHFWQRSDADLVGKVDNDCLMTPGWTRTIAQAHADVPELGAIGCWHFRQEDFDEKVAAHKIRTFGAHRVFMHPWIGGSGFLVKLDTVRQAGYWPEGADAGMTDLFVTLAQMGYVNGWYYPLILQDHMDDPYSRFTQVKSDADMRRIQSITYTPRVYGLETLEDRIQRRAGNLKNLLRGPSEVKYYFGWRGWVRKKERRVRDAIARQGRRLSDRLTRRGGEGADQ